MKYGVIEDDKFVINQARKSMELILFGQEINFDGNVSMYLKKVENADDYIGEQLRSGIAKRLNSNL